MSGQKYFVFLLTITNLFFIPLTSFSQSDDKEPVSSPGIVLNSPAQHINVAPNEIVEVNVSVDPSLNPEHVFFSGSMSGPFGNSVLEKTPSPDQSMLQFSVSLIIPDDASGAHELMGAVTNSAEGMVGGFMIRLNVIPQEIPVEIRVDKDFTLNLPARKFAGNRTIHVKGKYANGTWRNLRTKITGTTYKSMDKSVVTVTDSGVLNSVGSGRTYIIIEHRGLRAFAHVEVPEKGRYRFPAIDQTDKVLISESIPLRLPDSDRYEVNVTIQNISDFPLALPLNLVVTNLDKDIKVVDAGKTSEILPVGSPKIFVDVNERAYLSPNATANATITFINYTKKQPEYYLKLYSN